MSHLLKYDLWIQGVMDEEKALFFANKKESLLHPNAVTTYEEVQRHPGRYSQGHIVDFVPGAVHRLRALWGENADDFDLNRLTAGAKKEHKPYAWIPFGDGMHQCSGRKFGWNSLRATSLSWLVCNYELEFVGKGGDGLPKEDYTTTVVDPSNSHCPIKYQRLKAPIV